MKYTERHLHDSTLYGPWPPVMSIESIFVPLIRMLLHAELMPIGASWMSQSRKRLYQQ